MQGGGGGGGGGRGRGRGRGRGGGGAQQDGLSVMGENITQLAQPAKEATGSPRCPLLPTTTAYTKNRGPLRNTGIWKLKVCDQEE